MSCSSYCQGLQSCLEPARRQMEPCVLRLKLAPPKYNISLCPPPEGKSFVPDSDGNSKSSNHNVDMGGWSFLQSLASNTSQCTKEGTEKDKIYTPPNFKRSSSMLSEKSLEMCTESLGSETGSDGGESSDEMALLSLSNVNHESLREKSKFRETKRMMSRSTSFPPPLTSISGSTTVQVRPHREGGRLVLKAVSVSSCQAYFRAERIDGRLKLHLVKDCSPSHDPEEEKEEEEESLQEPSVDEESEGEEDNWEEEYSEENSGNGGAEMGMEKLPTPSRCKEGGSESKSLLNNWGTFWVAT
ncbi:protein FANTASTIC FOUR 2 [Hevea brasiliensis]|uniref:protein FANTASTIC FOUR 2 n=1 Tax=Hevea brasiliensis TaxID=3981 RepID=UPI00260060C4|nr:protein FANTASTIC FOUR 2 [Hevea brasiliensis]